MKKTKLFLLLVFICITLSFFSGVYANTSVTYFDVKDDNIVQSTDGLMIEQNYDGSITTITANAKYDTETKIYTNAVVFTAKSTGVYTIDVEGLTRYEGQDICYVLTNSSGQNVRLAAYYDENSKEYVTFSDKNEFSKTSIDVILVAGETYKISLSSYASKPGEIPKETTFGNLKYYTYADTANNDENYKITLKVNNTANNISNLYQSDIASSRCSNQHLPMQIMENPLEQYKMPDGATASFDGYGVDDGVSDIADALEEYVVSPFEETICELLLIVGDAAVSLISEVVGEEVTITKLVYNQIDAVNPNFFDSEVSSKGITANVKSAVSNWFDVFKLIAIAMYLVTLLVIGLRVLLSSTNKGIDKLKQMSLQWLKGLAYLVIVPYIIKYALLLNEALVGMLRESSNVSEDYQIGSVIGTTTDEWSIEEIEFRSPEYVSKHTGNVAFGSDEATHTYISRITTYEQNLDLMRIMRAYAGVTKKFVYIIIWFILIGQLMAFVYFYYKRFFMIAFLIAVFPIICIFQAITIIQGGNPNELESWRKELITNIFSQSIQAIIYTIITGICISVVKIDINSSVNLNWIVIILAINFVSEGEKLLRKIINSIGSGSSAGGVGESAQGVKGIYGKTKQGVNMVKTEKKPKKKSDDDDDDE